MFLNYFISFSTKISLKNTKLHINYDFLLILLLIKIIYLFKPHYYLCCEKAIYIYMYYYVWGWKYLLMFLKEVSYAHLSDQKSIKVMNYYYKLK